MAILHTAILLKMSSVIQFSISSLMKLVPIINRPPLIYSYSFWGSLLKATDEIVNFSDGEVSFAVRISLPDPQMPDTFMEASDGRYCIISLI